MSRSVYSLILLSLLFQADLFAHIGISGNPSPSAVLDLSSPNNDKAFYPPRLSSVQRLAIVNPQVGALVYDLDKNTLYLFDGQNWFPLLPTDTSLLAPTSRTATDGTASDYFGASVAISGDYALVGAYRKTIGSNSQQGAAYVFARSGNTWTQQLLLLASDGAATDYFGSSVAISGDYALVGTYGKTIGSNSFQGAVYVFARSGTSWPQQQELTASDGAATDNFGWSVAISGNYALVGAYHKTIGSNSSQGAAYIFMRSGSSWPQQQRVPDSSPAGTRNGYSVGLSNGTYLIGGYGYQTSQGKVSFGTVN